MVVAAVRRKRVNQLLLLFVTLYIVALVGAWKNPRRRQFPWTNALRLYGGSLEEAHQEEKDNNDDDDDRVTRAGKSPSDSVASEVEAGTTLAAPPSLDKKRPTKTRHASDLIVELRERSGLDVDDDDEKESHELRMLTSQRTADYVHELQESRHKIPDPRKLLHFLAPKIPAIKHSPDVALRIRAAPSDMDCGVAACMIGTLGHVCELYDQIVMSGGRRGQEDHVNEPHTLAAVDILKDRRFEQLVECVLCGVNFEKCSSKEAELNSELNAEHIEEVLDSGDTTVDEGLSVRDACRAAWGMAILGANRCDSIGGINILNLLDALAMRVRHLLLGRLQLLRQGDLAKDKIETIEEKLNDYSEELAEDAASVLWTFACVTACTGTNYPALFEACASILSSDPFEMRRRAQHVEATLETLAVGSNDVVERLERSEISSAVDESDNRTKHTVKGDRVAATEHWQSSTIREGRDALLDWLSPNELTDVLWAVALHDGKNETSSGDAVNLSRTVAIFCEVAFERAVSWLREDLERIQIIQKGRSHTVGPSLKEKGSVTEIVEASAILASEASQNNEIRSLEDGPQERPETNDSYYDRGIKLQTVGAQREMAVPVIDASRILASEALEAASRDVESFQKGTVEDSGHDRGVKVPTGEGTVVVKVVDAATILAAEASGNDYLLSNAHEADEHDERGSNERDGIDNEVFESPSTDEIAEGYRSIISSPRDLSCLAWAATEVNDSSRFVVTDLVTNIFFCMGSDSLKGLTGTGLSNLAWAIAQRKLEAIDSVGARGSSEIVLGWIADNALDYASLDASSSPGDIILQRFHPPELCRLVWSIATILSDRGESGWPTASIDALVYHALVTAGSNLSVFGTEDLARIVWAFFTLTDTTESIHWNHVSSSLGKILTTIELSLVQWESGRLSAHKDESSPTDHSESTRIASLFGRSRFHIPFLDQHVGDPLDDADVEPTQKSRLPLLREIPIDPLTLCKITSCFTKLGSRHPFFKTSDTLLRVGLRLFAPRNGRLLRQCPLPDLVRLMEASAVRESSACRELIGHFLRRTLQMINGLLPDGSGSVVLNLRSEEISTFMWSLGMMGVKHMPFPEDKATAHRRLHLISRPELPSAESLSVPNAIRLVHGLVATKLALRDKEYLSHLLLHIESNIASLQQESGICDLVETLAMLRIAIDDEQPAEVALDLDTNSTVSENDETNRALIEEVEEKSDELLVSCERMLASLGLASIELVQKLTYGGLLRIMTVLCQLPLQCDSLIETIQSVLDEREHKLGQIAGLEDAIDAALATVLSLRDAVAVDAPESPLLAMQHGLRAILRPGSKFSKDESDSSMTTDQQIDAREMEEMLTAIAGALDTVKKSLADGSLASATIPDGHVFQLSRCREAIEQYRRIDFSQGSRQSRFDKQRRLDMSKRLLSRLLP